MLDDVRTTPHQYDHVPRSLGVRLNLDHQRLISLSIQVRFPPAGGTPRLLLLPPELRRELVVERFGRIYDGFHVGLACDTFGVIVHLVAYVADADDLDARRLEEQACDDYRLTRDAYQALYPRISP